MCIIFHDLLLFLGELQIVFTPGQQEKCFLCGQMGHFAADCEGKAKRKSGEFDEKVEEVTIKKPYQAGFPPILFFVLW